MLTADRIRELLRYDPATGVFTWKVERRRGPNNSYVFAKPGEAPGSYNAKGYWQIGVDGRNYGAHRLAFLYMTGEWPKDQVDHRDGDKANNRWANLRDATPSQNMSNRSAHANNRLGVKGVYRKGNGYAAQIYVNRESIYLGTYPTLQEAVAIRNAAASDLHGEYARAS